MLEEKSKTELVQEKIKKMVQHRKRILSKGTPSQVKRLKSNFEGEDQSQEIGETKPKSSISNRPQSTYRAKNTEVRSITTDSSNRNDIDVAGLIKDVFDRGFQLSKYLTRKKLSPEECLEKLLGNTLFHTLIISRVSKVNEDQYESIVEREIIGKLQKMNVIARQEKNCQMIQEKISLLLEQRLKSLSMY